MKNSRSNLLRCASIAAPLIIALSPNAQAQLTWDPSFTEGAALGGDGFWEVPNTNWWNGAINTTWDNTGATTAIFPDFAGNQIVQLSTGLIVGDLEYQDDEVMQLRGASDNQVLAIKSGGATWDTGGGRIEFYSETNATIGYDVILSMGADTLTISGGGEFDTGERPVGATWTVSDATLDVTEVTVVRGQAASTGQFSSVNLIADSTFIQERNSNQDLNNDWVVTGPGNVKFGNRFNRISWLNGAFSGDAGLTFFDGASASIGYFRLNNAANSFTGGVVVDATNSETELDITVDAALGAIPASVDASNITLRNGGILKTFFTNLDANRGITLDGGGVLLPSTNLNVYGPVAGDGGLDIGLASDGATQYVLMRTANSYTGGTDLVKGNILVSNDNQLGEVPAVFDAANVTIRNGNILKFNFEDTTLDANRGITLDNGGVIVAGSTAPATSHVINGPITGTGDLTMGVSADGANGTITLNSAATYTGNTNIVRGFLQLGLDEALPASAIMTIGGNGSSTLDLNGYSQTIAGLQLAGNNTRSIRNSAGPDSTLTIDVADGNTYDYGANIDGSGLVNIVKDGLGTQNFNRGNYTTDPGNLTVNAGTLGWNVADSFGDVAVNDTGTLVLSQTGTAASFTAASGSTTNFEVAIGDWTGVAGTDWPLLTVTGNLDLPTGSTFTVKVSDGSITNFTDTTKSFVIASIGGTVTSLDGNITVDASGFTSGTGTWSLAPVAQDLVLTYTSTADPYGSWAATNITDIQPAAPAGFDDDADNDGVTNGLEFVLNGNPLVANSAVLPTISLDASNLTFSYTRSTDSKTSTTQIVQWSPDLDTWTNVDILSSDPDAVDVVIPRSNEVDGKLFTRLKVTNP